MSMARTLHAARLVLVCSGVALMAVASTANATSLRSPQVGFASADLQSFLNAADGGINTLTDQIDGQTFSTSFSGNTDFTMVLRQSASGSQNSIGVYNTLDPASPPALFQLFPSAATAGWSAFCHWSPSGGLAVNLYDNSFPPLLQGTTIYSGVDRAHFSFYLSNAGSPGSAGSLRLLSVGATYYSQDSRNGNNPQVLTYRGTGANASDWWECFEDAPYNAPTSIFTGVVLELQSVVPTPVVGSTWGRLKATYR